MTRTHPLHDYIAGQLAERLRRRVVVWYDKLGALRPFIAELRASAQASGDAGAPVVVTIKGEKVRLAEYAGSFFELRHHIEPLFAADTPDKLVVYVPERARDHQQSVLAELEAAGTCYEPDLDRLARNALAERGHADTDIDALLPAGELVYEEIARISAQDRRAAPSLLADTFGVKEPAAQLAAWLAVDTHDERLAQRGGLVEVGKLVAARVGLQLPAGAPAAKARAIVLRHLLGCEFRADLGGPPPPSVAALPEPGDEQLQFARAVAQLLRRDYAQAYGALADNVESELGLVEGVVDPARLGAIDTFRFEERALLSHALELVAARRFDEALKLVGERGDSFWLRLDVERRKLQWEVCARAAELGKAAAAVGAAVAAQRGTAADWVRAYADERDGWHRMDRAHRRLETLVMTPGNPDPEPAAERALGVVRRAYEEVCDRMAVGFTRALQAAGWSVPGALHQTRVFSDVLANRARPVAYFLVDSLRYEMGVELKDFLVHAQEIAVRPALAALPSITPVGMAALMPGAAASFDVVAQARKLGARIDGAFLADAGARKKHLAARCPASVDLTIDDFAKKRSWLKEKIAGAEIIVVRVGEIDLSGEQASPLVARHVMASMIAHIAGAVAALATLGIEHSVIAADHGHQFAADKDDSMKIDAPGGEQIDLHRRCWIGRGGSTPPGCVRVTGGDLGYATNLDFVFPAGAGVFKTGGALDYHHGGPSLQELVIPVLTIQMKTPGPAPGKGGPAVEVSGLPAVVTNRIFKIQLQAAGTNLSLLGDALLVRPVLVSRGKPAGDARVALGATLDPTTKVIRLEPGKPADVVLFLTDEQAERVTVVVQDPATDREYFRSKELPVKLTI